MTERDLFLDAIREKPVWRMTSDDLDALPPTERQWAINHLAFMREEGILALCLANPDGTKYETIWEQGRWKLRPLSSQITFGDFREMFQQELDAAFKRISDAVKDAVVPFGETADGREG